MTRQLKRLAYGRAVNLLAGEVKGSLPRQERKAIARKRLGNWKTAERELRADREKSR